MQFDRWAEKQLQLDYYRALIEFPIQHYIRTGEEFAENEAYNKLLTVLENTIDDTMILFSCFSVIERYNLIKKYGYNPMSKSVETYSEVESIDLLSTVSENSFFSQFTVATHLNIGLKANTTEIIDKNEDKINNIITNHFLRCALQNEYNRVKK